MGDKTRHGVRLGEGRLREARNGLYGPKDGIQGVFQLGMGRKVTPLLLLTSK